MGPLSQEVRLFTECSKDHRRDVEALVEYAYSGKIVISDGNARRILLLAACLDCDELREGCGNFLSSM